MRTFSPAFCLVSVFLGFATSAAAPPPPYEKLTLAEYDGLATSARILSLGQGWLVVAWRDPSGLVTTRSYWNDGLRPAEVHGPGIEPALFFGYNGVSLAYATGDQTIVRRFSGSWSPPIPVSSGSGATAHSPDFALSPGIYGPDLAWIEGTHVLFAEATSGGYGPPEPVAADANGDTWPGLQLCRTDFPGARPRVYYFDGGHHLVYRERVGPGNWTPPFPWPQNDWDCSWPLRVIPDGNIYERNCVLHLGVPRTCPCNEIYFLRETAPGAWSDPVRLTVVQAANNWPKFPSMTMQPDGTAHCFWQQSFYDEALQFLGEAMYYRAYREGVGWAEPWTFEDHGIYNDVSAGECVGCAAMPEFCWVELLDPGSRVVALRYAFTGSSAAAVPTSARLTVRPNPSSATALILSEAPASGPARLEIFDPAGRLVRRLVDGSGGSRFARDGRGEDGARLPAGVYRLRLLNPGGAASANLIRLR